MSLGEAWRILVEDAHLLVVEKDTGLLSVPGLGAENADCLVARVQGQFPGARIVHRLDRDTSGLMVLALDSQTHRDLSREFEQRRVKKEYEALVWGAVAESSGAIDLPIRKDMTAKTKHLVDHVQGKPSQTDWWRLELGADGSTSRLRLEPRTGRSHQLRLHLSSIGHPILGDPIYGSEHSRTAAPRLCLHATRLEFTHPRTGAQVLAQSSAPF